MRCARPSRVLCSTDTEEVKLNVAWTSSVALSPSFLHFMPFIHICSTYTTLVQTSGFNLKPLVRKVLICNTNVSINMYMHRYVTFIDSNYKKCTQWLLFELLLVFCLSHKGTAYLYP